MAKKDKQGITQKQYVTLSDVSAGLATLDVYGKILTPTWNRERVEFSIQQVGVTI